MECGGPAAVHQRWGHPLKYCSTRCKSRRNARELRRRKAEQRSTICVECQQTFEQPPVGRPRKFCSDACKARFHNRRNRRRWLPLRDPNPEPKACAHCGKLFIPRNRNRIYCYGWCGQAAYQQRKREGAGPRMVKREVACDNCGTVFIGEHPAARWCTPECARRHWTRVKSRQRGGGVSTADYSDLAIFDRDGWLCHLCGAPVDPELSRSHLMGATIDHIVPLSLGGEDTEANVALAHNSCNRRKSALLLDD